MSVFDSYQAAQGKAPATPAVPAAPAPSLVQNIESGIGNAFEAVKGFFGGAPATPKTPAPVAAPVAPAAPKSVYDTYQAATNKTPVEPLLTAPTTTPTTNAPENSSTPEAPAGPDKGMQVSPYFAAVDSKNNSYGFSDQLDPSGVPYFAYRAPGDTATTTDYTRVAVSGFDPRVAQPVKASEFLTPRAVANRAQLKTQMGGNYSDELDHVIALELAGSNNKANLQIEPDVPGTNNTATDPLENSLAKQVVAGKMSLFQAQTALAQAKGKTVPFTGAAPAPKQSFLGNVGADFNAIKNTYGDLAKRVGGVFADFLGTPEGKSTEGGQQGAIDADLHTTPGTGAIGAYQAAAENEPTQSSNPVDWAKATWNSLTSTIKDSADKLSTAEGDVINIWQTAMQGKQLTPEQKLKNQTDAGEAGLGLLNGIFSLFSAPLAGAAKVPGVIGKAADTVNNLMTALGAGASNAAVQDIVNKLPISESTKAQIRPVVGDIAALAAQIVAGDVAGRAAGIHGTETKVEGAPAKETPPPQVTQIVAKTKELAGHLQNALAPENGQVEPAPVQNTPKVDTSLPHEQQVVQAHQANAEAAGTTHTPLPEGHAAGMEVPEALAKYHLEDMGQPQKGLANLTEARHLITTLEGELKDAHPDSSLRTDAQNTMQTHLDALKQYVTDNKAYERYWSGKVPGDTISRAERAASDPTSNQSAKYVERYSGDVLDAIEKGHDVPKEVIAQRPEFGDAAALKDKEEMQREAAFGTLHESSSFKEGNVGDRYDLPVGEVHNAVRSLFPDPKEVDFLFPNQLYADEGYKLHGRYTPERAFRNPMIEAVQKDGKISSHTLYHEAFHHFFKNFLSEDEQKELIKNVKRNPLSFKERAGAIVKTHYATADIRAEEFLANDFAKYMREKTGIKENVTIYEKIKAIVQQLVRKISGLSDTYERIANGDRSFRKPSRLFTGKEDFVPKWEEDTSKEEEKTPAQKVEELKAMRDIYKEAIDNHPAKDLQKYVSKTTGRLPEVTGKDTMKSLTGNGKNVATSEFGKRGDQIVEELGYQSVDHAEQALGSVQQLREQYKDVTKALSEAQKEARADKQAKYMAMVKPASKLGPPIEGDFDANGKLTPQARAERKAQLRIYPDKEMAKKLGTLHQDYNAYRADVMKRGGQGVFAKPPLDKAGRVLGRSDMPTVIDGLRQAYHGEIETGPRKFRGMAEEARDWFQNFVYRRRNVGIETRSALSTFSDLIGKEAVEKIQKDGLQSLHDYDGVPLKDQEGKLQFDEHGNQRFKVAPKRSGAYGKLADLYKQLYDQEKAAGIPVGEKQNYQPIYVEKTGEQTEAEKLRLEQMPEGKRVSLRPNFTLSRDFDSYGEAMQAGKKPVFNDLLEVLNERLNQHYKAMANAQMWNEGVRSGYIIPSEMVNANKDLIAKEYPGAAFKSYDPDHVPSRATGYTSRDSSVEHVNTQGWVGPKPIVDLMNGYLKEPDSTFEKGLRSIARFAGTARNMVLGVGIPKTALTVHYFNVLGRETAANFFAGDGRAKEVFKSMAWTLKPSEAAKFIDANLEKAMPLYRAGMLFSSDAWHMPEENEYTSTLQKLGNRYTQASHAWHNWFGGNFFESFLPARMMQNGMRLADKYKAAGMEEGAAYKRAADEMNVLYGNIDAAAIGRDKNLQNAIRAFALAPNFLENNMRLGSKMVKGMAEDMHLKKPIEPGTKEYALYAKYAYFVLGAYAVGNILNYENSGKLMWQNDPLHQFDINFGTDSKGKTRYVGMIGTGADMVRLPLEIAAAIAQGKPQDITTSIRDRASTVFGPAISLVANSDWQGDPIVGPDKYGKPQSAGTQVGNIFNNTIGSQFPGQLSTAVSALGGKQSTEQTVTGFLGAPVHYKNEQPNATSLNAAVANSPKAQAMAAIVPIYQRITAQGKTDPAGAQQAYDALTDAQKAAYQKYKSGQKSKATVAAEAKILSTYQKAQSLAQSGDTAGAQALYDALTPSDKHAYQLIKARFAPTAK